METADLSYLEYRTWPIEGCQETIHTLEWTHFAAVSFELDDSISAWARHPGVCVANVIILCIISIREGFLPDYLQRLLREIRDISDLLDDEERAWYKDDLRTLEILM